MLSLSSKSNIDILNKKYIIKVVIYLIFSATIIGCSSSQPKKRSQPKRGPIPCPVKDC
jgi:hypothetical protein